MGRRIEWVADWCIEEFDHHRIWLVWFCRGWRWLYIATTLFSLVRDHPPIWAVVALVAVDLYGEFRDWRSRRTGYSNDLQLQLVVSITAWDWVADILLCLFLPTNVQSPWLLVEFVLFFPFTLIREAQFQSVLAERSRTIASALPPPLLAEYVLYFALPRREREPLLGDLNEDFATNLLPRFGPLCARGWYWYKAILYVGMYICQNAIRPFIQHVIEPGAGSFCPC